MRSFIALLLLFSVASALQVDFYYGDGCPHCAATEQMFSGLSADYDLDIIKHEVYYDAGNRAALISQYDRFGYDIGKGGVPTTVIGDAMIIGSLSEEQWKEFFDACEEGCPTGIFSADSFDIDDGKPPDEIPKNDSIADPIEEKDGTMALTLPVLIGAALVDSVNPCTIAVMVLLIGAVLYAKGKQSALTSGLVFTFVIFIMYMLYGLGIMKAITTFELTNLFYAVVTVGALVLSVMEFNAYFNYKPGFFAVEMPMWLRPHVKKATSDATSPLGVAVAAVFCSLFLLPCSSGPYLLVLGMLAKAATLQTLSYLVLYNLLFVAPMVVITVAIHVGKTSVEQIGGLKEKYIKEIHLFSGVVLFLLFLLMLNQVLGLV